MSARTADSLIGRLATLGDPLRLRALRVLESEELSVGEVASVLQLPQSTASRHLKHLADAGWLTKRSAGTATYFSVVLDDLPMGARELWLTVRGQLEGSAELAADDLRLRGVLAERMSDSRAYFGRVAGQWDEVRQSLFGERFMARALLGLVPRGWVVADLGCGTGNVAELLSPWVSEVVAIDREGSMLEAARQRLGGCGNVRFVEAELDRLPLGESSVDAAVCSLVLHHCEEPGRVMSEVARVLRARGVAVVIDMVGHDRQEYRRQMGHKHLGFGTEAVVGLFREAGLSEPVVVPLAAEPGASGPGLFAAVGRK